jgi:hypothetical protein
MGSGRGGARPGAGRPPKDAAERKRDQSAKQLSRCKDKIQESLPELIAAAIDAALGGDRALLKFLLEQGIGKAPVMPTATPDTQIQVVLGNIPRPKRNTNGDNPAEADLDEPTDEEALAAVSVEAEPGDSE